jgi:hypothetical protein
MGIHRDIMAKLKFVGKISDMGDRKIIYIPKEYHKDAEKMKGKQVLIAVNDEILGG